MKAIPMLKMSISMTIFGSIGFFSIKTGLPSFELVFVRCICATLFLSLCWVLSGQSKKEKWNKREIVQIVACGIFLVFNWVFLFKAFEMMSVTVAISIYHLAPVLVLLIGSVIFKEKLTVLSFLSIIICFIGTLLIIGINNNTSFHELLSSGIIWALLAALFYAFTTLLGKGIKHTSAYAMTFLQTFLGIIILIPFVDFDSFTGLTQNNWIAITATGLVHTGLVYYLFFDSLRYLPTKIISALVFLDPGVAILLDTLFTGFRPTFIQILGIVLIFSGMAFSLKKPKTIQVELSENYGAKNA
ncbi:DMT family transporter [Aneurinibacillus migulanus]|uniref:Transporter n=1 Tax=Aneurinibacillus migulanus TaxID=47500 RepID=A0A0D1Y3B3_ANEMI|nr:DMT family transporter [Aneurinibacillus migulanus]KIV58848.1 transporter [Aneurinibacillus migulanus]KON96540.1 transporter [Aneurinibacillus migulanus]MED0890751.1 DMT family transporter [Aneurinibacillus migulanus]MED1618296.1 DMT family transporter [Aneurinibacillus migulanus]MED4727798.1 DMT family transporter [Aneurinibacillus migulanus]